MNSFATSVSAGVLAAFAVAVSGCGDAPPPASIPNPESTTTTTDNEPVTSDDVQREAGEAFNTTAKYANQTKDEYQAAMQKKLGELDTKIDELQVKADAASKEAKADAQREYREAMTTLKAKRQALSEEFAEFKKSSGDAWRDVAAGVDSAWNEVSTAFSQAASHFEDPYEDDIESSPDSTE